MESSSAVVKSLYLLMWGQKAVQLFRGTALQTSPRAWLLHPLCARAWATWTCLLRTISLVSWFEGEAGRNEALKTLHFSVLVFYNTPRATAKCIRPQHSQILLKSLHNSSSQAKKNRASRKQVTVGKQEYLSLTTMALSNQRGRADEPLITCAIMTSVSSIPWQAGSRTCYALLSTGLKLIRMPLTQLATSFKTSSTQR